MLKPGKRVLSWALIAAMTFSSVHLPSAVRAEELATQDVVVGEQSGVETEPIESAAVTEIVTSDQVDNTVQVDVAETMTAGTSGGSVDENVRHRVLRRCNRI